MELTTGKFDKLTKIMKLPKENRERDNSYLIGNKFAKGHAPNRTCFKPGVIPWNKGSKGRMKANSGSFKKGGKPPTWLPVGSITKRRHQREGKQAWTCVFVKVAEPDKWVPLGRYLWEKKRGRIPRGSVIIHKDLNS